MMPARREQVKLLRQVVEVCMSIAEEVPYFHQIDWSLMIGVVGACRVRQAKDAPRTGIHQILTSAQFPDSMHISWGSIHAHLRHLPRRDAMR